MSQDETLTVEDMLEGAQPVELHLLPPREDDHPDRQWHDNHLRAGYHLQEWVVPTEDHEIIGAYDILSGNHGGSCEVRFIHVGQTNAPELELECADGLAVTVLDHTVAEQYLELWGATRREE